MTMYQDYHHHHSRHHYHHPRRHMEWCSCKRLLLTALTTWTAVQNVVIIMHNNISLHIFSLLLHSSSIYSFSLFNTKKNKCITDIKYIYCYTNNITQHIYTLTLTHTHTKQQHNTTTSYFFCFQYIIFLYFFGGGGSGDSTVYCNIYGKDVYKVKSLSPFFFFFWCYYCRYRLLFFFTSYYFSFTFSSMGVVEAWKICHK